MTQSPAPGVSVRWIYHFTHIDNLAPIRAATKLRCDSVAREGVLRTEVGDPDIKESRRRRSIPIEPGGRVGDYVPFYFAPRSPMMYASPAIAATAFRTATPAATNHWSTS